MKIFSRCFWLIFVLLANFQLSVLAQMDATNLVTVGRNMELSGDLDGALANFNKAIKVKPDYALAYMRRGNIKDEKGDSDGAMADYNKSLELQPNLALAYYNRGLLKNQENDSVGALKDYDKSIQYDY